VNKSDKLDELRLEVGMVADQTSTRHDFYLGIVNAIGRNIPQQFGVAIYLCHQNKFIKLGSYGNISEKKIVKYGEGMFSICSIRGKVVIENKYGKQRLYAPFYNNQELLGVFYAECQDPMYEVTEEDLVFIKEITRYIEVRVILFTSSPIDNLDY
jgi:L-methionine (R)-S-oxide reductase